MACSPEEKDKLTVCFPYAMPTTDLELSVKLMEFLEQVLPNSAELEYLLDILGKSMMSGCIVVTDGPLAGTSLSVPDLV